MRVPAVIISPYIAPGSVVRAAPAGLPAKGPPYPFDHTSIIKTLRRLFDLGPAMTQRDDAAPDLLDALSLLDPENDGPESRTPTAATPSAEEVKKRAAAPPNSMQRNLCRLAAQLPAKGQPPAAAPGSPPVPATAKDAHAFVAPRVKAFLGR